MAALIAMVKFLGLVVAGIILFGILLILVLIVIGCIEYTVKKSKDGRRRK